MPVTGASGGSSGDVASPPAAGSALSTTAQTVASPVAPGAAGVANALKNAGAKATALATGAAAVNEKDDDAPALPAALPAAAGPISASTGGGSGGAATASTGGSGGSGSSADAKDAKGGGGGKVADADDDDDGKDPMARRAAPTDAKRTAELNMPLSEWLNMKDQQARAKDGVLVEVTNMRQLQDVWHTEGGESDIKLATDALKAIGITNVPQLLLPAAQHNNKALWSTPLSAEDAKAVVAGLVKGLKGALNVVGVCNRVVAAVKEFHGLDPFEESRAEKKAAAEARAKAAEAKARADKEAADAAKNADAKGNGKAAVRFKRGKFKQFLIAPGQSVDAVVVQADQMAIGYDSNVFGDAADKKTPLDKDLNEWLMAKVEKTRVPKVRHVLMAAGLTTKAKVREEIDDFSAQMIEDHLGDDTAQTQAAMAAFAKAYIAAPF